MGKRHLDVASKEDLIKTRERSFHAAHLIIPRTFWSRRSRFMWLVFFPPLTLTIPMRCGGWVVWRFDGVVSHLRVGRGGCPTSRPPSSCLALQVGGGRDHPLVHLFLYFRGGIGDGDMNSHAVSSSLVIYFKDIIDTKILRAHSMMHTNITSTCSDVQYFTAIFHNNL